MNVRKKRIHFSLSKKNCTLRLFIVTHEVGIGDGMFVIGEAVIDDAVAQASFCCNVRKCKGACCCIEGGRGAPLEDDEVLEIEKAYPVVKEYLSKQSNAVIETSGMYEGAPGTFATMCIDHRQCVFVYFEDGIARCSFERAYEEGKIEWRKPLSCHLFPIRIRGFGKDFLSYEMIDECQAGRELGMAKQIKLHDFLKEPLTRKYGENWYNSFVSMCRRKLET